MMDREATMKTAITTFNKRLSHLLVFALTVTSISATAGETVRYVHTDHLGTPIVWTDKDGNVIRTAEYEPYGLQVSGPVTDGPGYTGHVEDAATGLTYMQQRYYDPGIGMFLSIDPVTAYGNPVGQFNRYRYANGNPYAFIDPNGGESVCALVKGCSSPQPPSSTEIAIAETVVDFTPIVGDVKAIAEAAQDPSAAKITVAVVGIVPGAGDVAAKIINKATHIFGKAEHKMGSLLGKFDSAVDATKALEQAGQEAFEKGAMKVGEDGVVSGATRVQVNGVDVDLLGGRVVDGKFELGSASRREIEQ